MFSEALGRCRRDGADGDVNSARSQAFDERAACEAQFLQRAIVRYHGQDDAARLRDFRRLGRERCAFLDERRGFCGCSVVYPEGVAGFE